MIARRLAAALLGLGLLAAGPMTDVSFAQEKAVKKSTPAKSGLRECRAKGAGNKILTWKCKAEQPCCYNATANKGVCGSPVIGCF